MRDYDDITLMIEWLGSAGKKVDTQEAKTDFKAARPACLGVRWKGRRFLPPNHISPQKIVRVRITTSLSQDHKDILSTLEKMSEVRIERHSLPASLVDRMKGGVKSWRKAREAQAEQRGPAALP